VKAHKDNIGATPRRIRAIAPRRHRLRRALRHTGTIAFATRGRYLAFAST